MGLVVRLLKEVNIVRGNQSQIQVACDFHQFGVDSPLCIKAKIMNLDEIIFSAEDVPIGGGSGLRLIKASSLQERGDLAFQASAEGDDALRVRSQPLPVHAGFVVKSLQISCRRKLHKIPIALVVCREQREVECGILRG